MHSVALELAKLILIGTRTTYQATGDAFALYEYKAAAGYNMRMYVPANALTNRSRWPQNMKEKLI